VDFFNRPLKDPKLFPPRRGPWDSRRGEPESFDGHQDRSGGCATRGAGPEPCRRTQTVLAVSPDSGPRRKAPGEGVIVAGHFAKPSTKDLTACRHRRCVSRVKVPRKELFVHLSRTGKQRLNHQGLKFPMGKAAGRCASEPRRSLVTELEMPTLWSEGEGRCLREQHEHPPSGSSGVAGAACGGRDTVQDGRSTAVRA